MSTSATVVMLIAMVMIWGGLIVSIVHLMKNPDIEMDEVPND